MARDETRRHTEEATRSWMAAAAIIACLLLTLAWGQSPAHAACGGEQIVRGRVAKIVDARTLILEDAQVVRLAGLELADAESPRAAPTTTSPDAEPVGQLNDLLAGHKIILLGAGATARDRYGRLIGFAKFADTDESVQEMLVRRGLALVSAQGGDRDCVVGLLAAENEARLRKAGAWAAGFATKNAESPDEIGKRVGRFVIAEGSVSSVREAGATIYVNFGRRWTRDLAATIPRRLAKSFERAGFSAKSMERRKVRVRGWVEMRGGPRIAVARPEQIEVMTER